MPRPEKFGKQMVEKARQRIGEYLFPKLTAAVDGRHRLVDQPPVLFHVAEKGAEKMFLEGWKTIACRCPTIAASCSTATAWKTSR